MDEKVTKRRAFLINLCYVAAIVALVILAVKYLIPWLMPFIIGFAVAMLFHPLIRWTSKKLKISRKVVSCVVVIIGYAIIIALVVFLVIELVSGLSGFFSGLPDMFNSQISPTINAIGDFFSDLIDKLPESWAVTIDNIGDTLIDALKSAVSSVSSSGLKGIGNFVSGLPGFLIALIFTILASFYMSMHYDKTKAFVMAQLPERGQEILRAVKSAFKDSVFAYIRAYFKIMCITFCELTIGFLILRIGNPVPKALGIAVFDILPVFGTGGILIPWVIIDLILGKTFEALGLLVLYGVITVVRNFIEPKIVGDNLGLNPIVSLIAIYLGYVWLGVLGMILMPIAVQIVISLHKKGIISLYRDPPGGYPSDEQPASRRAFGRGKKSAPSGENTAGADKSAKNTEENGGEKTADADISPKKCEEIDKNTENS